MQKLNIPLESSSTRRFKGRVVWILAFSAMLVVTGLVLFTTWTSRDTVSSATPEGTLYTLRIEKTARVTGILSDKQGDMSLSPILPWTMTDLLQASNREFALHFDEKGLIGFTLDRELDKNTLALAESVGSFSLSEDKTTTFSINKLENTTSKTVYHPFSVFPWNNGQMINAEASFPIHINKKGISIRKTGLATQIESHIALSTTSEPFAVLEIAPDSITEPFEVYNFTGLQLEQKLFNEVMKNGALIILASDELGTSYSLSIPSTEFSIDELAAIGRDMMARRTLTTTALTSVTGEKFEEIVLNDEHLESDIRAEEDFSYILLKNTAGDVLRLTKTESSLVISNRDISAEISEFSPTSDCLLRANTFVDIQTLQEEFITPHSITPPFEQGLFSTFSIREVAISKKKTRLCW
jgi:hypothetical protein